jgi:hypothetical protein
MLGRLLLQEPGPDAADLVAGLPELEALVTYVRAAAERRAETIPAICGRIASRHDVQLAATT